jgi:hypothetical protein
VRRRAALFLVLAPLWGCELLVNDGDRSLATAEAGGRDGSFEVSSEGSVLELFAPDAGDAVD